MAHLDLRRFADHSVKIPSSLTHKTEKHVKPGLFKVLLSHWIDAIIISTMTFVTFSLFSNFSNIILTSAKLKNAGGKIPVLSIFILLSLAYHFVSYFLNHGQTLGLYNIKMRVCLKDKDFRNAIKWSIRSTFTCLTGGLDEFIFHSSKILVPHDYLYHGLMEEKEFQTIKLLDLTNKAEEKCEKSSAIAA